MIKFIYTLKIIKNNMKLIISEELKAKIKKIKNKVGTELLKQDSIDLNGKSEHENFLDVCNIEGSVFVGNFETKKGYNIPMRIVLKTYIDLSKFKTIDIDSFVEKYN